MSSLKKFVANESGATAFEYALLCGLIGVAIVSALTAFANKLSSSFSNISAKLS